jgi:hypothetical protein
LDAGKIQEYLHIISGFQNYFQENRRLPEPFLESHAAARSLNWVAELLIEFLSSTTTKSSSDLFPLSMPLKPDNHFTSFFD